MKKLIPFIVFVVTFLLLANWHVFISNFTGLQKPRNSFEKMENNQLTEFIQQKTGVVTTHFYIVNSESTFATMVGLPGKPIMTISKKLYETFTEDELHYVVLHETGHYNKQHSAKEFFLQLLIVTAFFFVSRSLKISYPTSIFFSCVTALVTGVVVIQLMRLQEWEADRYALERLDNPESMIQATKKLQENYQGPSDYSWQRMVFYRGIPYSTRIEYAKNFDK